MPAARTTSGLYSVHPGLAMMEKWINNLPAKTGRTLDEWIAFVKRSGPPTEKERREWLKKEHKLGTNSAICIAERADGKGTEEDSPEAYLEAAEKWVDAMFTGPKAALRPVYDHLLKTVLAVSKDVKACPGKTAVAIYRNRVFANIKVATNTRIDLGLALKNMKTPKRLIDTGGYQKKDRITRRIEVKVKADIDDELKKWLMKAWEIEARH
jgi:predicted transport protein